MEKGRWVMDCEIERARKPGVDMRERKAENKGME